MVSYLQIEGLTKSYGDRLLFADITLGIYEGDKIGLIARNGTGKSTLLNLIAGRESADSGSIVFRNSLRVGYLEQNPHFDLEKGVMANLCEGHANDYGREDRAKSLLGRFGIHDLELPMGRMSGGQIKRAALARTLLDDPEMLILDEPTNHLDIDMIEWLEQYLSRQRTTLLMVTHDRYFLDRVCNRIIEIDRQQLFSYDGNYDYYLTKRTERMEQLAGELAKVKNILRTEQEWMRRQPQARGSKAKYRIDNFHELERRSHVNLSQDDVRLASASSYIGSKIFEANAICKAFGEKVILRDWSYIFARYEKVGIVGDNGVGKTTFIKLLLGELQPDSGSFDIGQTVKWGYYSQSGMTEFDENKKVIDAVRDIAEDVTLDGKTRISASQFLTHFLFPVSRQQDYIAKLSGGERRRLYLATVLMRSPNFLILDEPTNDLDITTLSVLEDYLANFKGCAIVVSHDRFFLDRVADHLFVFKGDGVVKDFPGDYSTYRHCLAMQQAEEQKLQKEKTSPAKCARPKTERPPRLTFKEKREMEQLEKDLEAYAQEKTRLETEMCSGELDHTKILEASQRVAQLTDLIDEAELRLLELMEKSDS